VFLSLAIEVILDAKRRVALLLLFIKLIQKGFFKSLTNLLKKTKQYFSLMVKFLIFSIKISELESFEFATKKKNHFISMHYSSLTHKHYYTLGSKRSRSRTTFIFKGSRISRRTRPSSVCRIACRLTF